jgi:hypothetical protein
LFEFSLAPVLAPVPSRIGSGSNRRQSHASSFKKRYSSIEATNVDNKSIVVHGSALSKPAADHTHNHSAHGHANQTQNLINSSTNSFLPISNQSSTSGVGTMNSTSVSNSAQLINRSNNSSSQTFHSNLLLTANEMHTNYENEYETIEHPVNNNNREHSIDEINLLTSNNNTGTNNGAGASLNNNKLLYHHSHHQLNNLYINTPFHPHHQSSNHSTLPPIENSLAIKPRISSANNLKQYRDRSDRPMTSAATRVRTIYHFTFFSNVSLLNGIV